jgi:hypothetical protein
MLLNVADYFNNFRNAAMIHRDPAIGFFCGGTLVSKTLVITG